jgi:hypothetical protein
VICFEKESVSKAVPISLSTRQSRCSERVTYARLDSAAHSARALLRVSRLGLQGAVFRFKMERRAVWAGVAQLVEHLICNQRVGGSNPFVSSIKSSRHRSPMRFSSRSCSTERRIWLYCLPSWHRRPPVTPSRQMLSVRFEVGVEARA